MGRGDRKGSFRISAFAFSAVMLHVDSRRPSRPGDTRRVFEIFLSAQRGGDRGSLRLVSLHGTRAVCPAALAGRADFLRTAALR